MYRPIILMLCWAVTLATTQADEIEFNRDIRPILSENCYHCHGPDDEARSADLRLDTREGATEYAIVVGDSEASEVFARVTSDDPDSIMPPPDSERSLTKEQIELLGKWIDQGAKFEGHWAFVSPRRPELPSVTDASKATSAIDQFVLAKLQQHQLQLAPQADRETLIRRVTFDLIGLPPTIEEIDAFLADTSEDAYEKLIDRLLKRPEYGERMASVWLDNARYSDTYGYQVDRDRFVWPWRDWVVRSLNNNLPYDQFILQQLAGDLLPNASRDQILATTFNRLHPQKVEGGSVPEEFRIEYVADRTQTVGTAIMGLTFECCRCHNHKYDPISQAEYYGLSAFFDNIDEAGLYSYFTQSVPTPTMTLPTADQEAKLVQQQAKIDAALEHLAATRNSLSASKNDWFEKLPKDYGAVLAKPILHLDFEGKASGKNQTVEDGYSGKAIQLSGDDAVDTKVGNFRREKPFSIGLAIKTPNHKERAVVFHRSRAWTDAASRGYQLLIEDGRLSWSLIHFWPGNAIRIRTVDPIPVDQWMHVVVCNDGSSRATGLRIFIDGKPAKTEIVRDRLTKNITGGGGDNIAIGQRFRDNGFTDGQVDELKVFDRELTELEVLQLGDPDSFQKLVSEESESDLIAEHRLVLHKEFQGALEKLTEARQAKGDTENALQEIMVMREDPVQRTTHVLNRGAYDQPGDQVTPITPQALPSYPAQIPQNRLGLAKWLTDPEHPLTSRVAVNRLWQMCFGVGLVRTPEDFGSQGEPPTHPRLLDWLAVEFVESGWDVKALLKQIMMSSTYRQSSLRADHRLQELDPENRLFSVFPSYRLSAEMLRDNALAISGRLVRKIGGPPVKPYELEASFKPSKRDSGEGLYRRSLYTYWKRTGPAPAMMALDAAKRDVCRMRRERTSSPLQAFVLLNGPQYVEAARGLAEKVLHQHAEPAAAVQHAFRRLTSRHANATKSLKCWLSYSTNNSRIFSPMKNVPLNT